MRTQEITQAEACAELRYSRGRISQMLDEGKLTPIMRLIGKAKPRRYVKKDAKFARIKQEREAA